MNLDLGCVESFVVLAGERHFGRAAQFLSLSPSALSKRISRLEKSIGTRLIQRDTGGFIDLTRAGVRFLIHCEPLLRAAREARTAALQTTESYVVRIGIPGSPTDHFPLQAWRMVSLALRQLVPGCRLELRDVPYGWVEKSLLAGGIDVLLTSSFVDHANLVSDQLGVSGRVLHVPRGHELEDARETTLADVADFTLIREPTAPTYWMAPWLLGDLRGPRDVRAVDIRAQNIGDIDRAVYRGVAVAVFSALTPLTHSDLVAIPILDAPLLPFYAVRRRHDDRDAVLGLLQTLRVLSAALAARQAGSSLKLPSEDIDAWWVAWSVASVSPGALGHFN